MLQLAKARAPLTLAASRVAAVRVRCPKSLASPAIPVGRALVWTGVGMRVLLKDVGGGVVHETDVRVRCALGFSATAYGRGGCSLPVAVYTPSYVHWQNDGLGARLLPQPRCVCSLPHRRGVHVAPAAFGVALLRARELASAC